MKTIQKRWLPLFLLATVTFLFPACEGNNPDEDLEGVITIKMRNDNNGRTVVYLTHGDFYITKADNFSEYSHGYSYYTDFCDMGVKKLSALKTIPTLGYADQVAVIPNHSYVIRAKHLSNGNIYYYKLHVVDYITSTSSGIIGAEVQYCEWTPEQ